MSQGLTQGCEMDVLQGQVKDIFKDIVDDVFQKDGWKIDLKMGVREIDVMYQGDKIVYGASIEIPIEMAEQKYGLKYGPQSADGRRRSVPFGRTITKQEAAKIRAGDTSLLDSEEFKNRKPVIGIDVHKYDDVEKDKEMEARRQRLQETLADVGGIATAIDNSVQGARVLEARGKFPGGAEAVRKALTQNAIEAIRSGAGVIQYKVSLSPKSKTNWGTETLQQQPTPGKPTQQGPLGLTR